MNTPKVSQTETEIKCPECGSTELHANLSADSHWQLIDGVWMLSHFTLFEERAQISCGGCDYEFPEGYLPLTTAQFDRCYFPAFVEKANKLSTTNNALLDGLVVEHEGGA